MNIYDERIGATIIKTGSDTNNVVGLPTSITDAIYDNGFKLNQGYGYGGRVFNYIAISKFPE